jgi:YVTN family beta-propeller protein
VRRKGGIFAYVTVGGRNEVQVFRTSDYRKVAVIRVGALPHGIWPSGDGSRVYVGLENADRMIVIETATNEVIASIPIGQAPQALVYVPNAVPAGDGVRGLQPLGLAGEALHLKMQFAASGRSPNGAAPTSVTLFDQGITQVFEAAVTGLKPSAAYTLALSTRADGAGRLEPLAEFTTNSAGAAIVNAVGPIRQLVRRGAGASRRYLVIATRAGTAAPEIVQVQAP